MALKLNEGRACEAIVRHLEKREKDTGIEPFEGHMKMEAHRTSDSHQSSTD